MLEDGDFFEFIRQAILLIAPLTFILGMVLIFYGNYQKLEEMLSKEFIATKKFRIPRLEDNIITFHEWLLKKKVFIGIISVSASAFFYFTLK